MSIRLSKYVSASRKKNQNMQFYSMKKLHNEALSILHMLDCKLLAVSFSILGCLLSAHKPAFAADTTPTSSQVQRLNISDDFLQEAEEKARRGGYSAQDGELEFQTLPRPAGAEAIFVDVTQINLSGNTVFSTETLQDIQKTRLSKNIRSLADLYDLADAITTYYREKGYPFARAIIPPQEICCQIALIAIDEGLIGEVKAEGDFADNYLVAHAIKQIRAHPVFNTKRVERELLLLNDIPAANFRTILKKNPTADKIDIYIVGKQSKRYNASFEFDNTGSKYLGPYLFNADMVVRNLLGLLGETTISAQTAAQYQEMNAVNVQHLMPVARTDLTLDIRAGLSEGEPGYLLKSSDVETRSLNLHTSLHYALLRQRNHSLSVSAGLGLTHAETEIAGFNITKDDTRVLLGGITYDFFDDAGGFTEVELAYGHGLGGVLGGSSTGDVDLSRSDADMTFNKLEISAYHLRPLPDLMGISGVSLLGAVTAQISDSPLVSSEEFSFGGRSFGRAYDPSQLSGDSGIATLLELRLPALPEMMKGVYAQPFVYADYGSVWNLDNNQNETEQGASTGLGLRAFHEDGLNGTLTVTQPLMKRSDTAYSNNGGPRLRFSLGYRY
jgi:hemolysin activation/secretion protein